MMLSSVGSVDVLPSLSNAKYNCLAILCAHLWCVLCRAVCLHSSRFFCFTVFYFLHLRIHSLTHSQTCWRRRRRRCAARGEWEREREKASESEAAALLSQSTASAVLPWRMHSLCDVVLPSAHTRTHTGATIQISWCPLSIRNAK